MWVCQCLCADMVPFVFISLLIYITYKAPLLHLTRYVVWCLTLFSYTHTHAHMYTTTKILIQNRRCSNIQEKTSVSGWIYATWLKWPNFTFCLLSCTNCIRNVRHRSSDISKNRPPSNVEMKRKWIRHLPMRLKSKQTDKTFTAATQVLVGCFKCWLEPV